MSDASTEALEAPNEQQQVEQQQAEQQAEAAGEAQKGTLTATLKTSIVKPLDGEWAELGAVLRALRAPLHRIMNAAVRGLELGPQAPVFWRRDKQTVSESCWTPSKTDVEKQRPHCAPRTACFRMVTGAWQEERELAQARIAKGKYYAGDPEIVKYPPSSQVILGVSGVVFARWQKYSKEKWKGTQSLPSFRGDSPIYVNSLGVKLVAKDGNYILRLFLDKWRDVVVRVDGGSAHADIKRIAEGIHKLGDARVMLITDRSSSKPKWMANLAHTFERPTMEKGRTCAVHRGLKSFLTVAIEKKDGQQPHAMVLETGEDILEHKRRYAATRAALGRQGRQLGQGAMGHGTKRRYERITRLEDSEQKWIENKCRQVAANLFRRMERSGATHILLEDWSNPARDGAPGLGEHLEKIVRQFPLGKLAETIEWGAKRRGFAVERVATSFNSRDCPACGHRHEKAQSSKFLCEECKLERPSEIVFVWNMLRRVGSDPGIEEMNAKAAKAAAKLTGSETGRETGRESKTKSSGSKKAGAGSRAEPRKKKIEPVS